MASEKVLTRTRRVFVSVCNVSRWSAGAGLSPVHVLSYLEKPNHYPECSSLAGALLWPQVQTAVTT